MSRPHYQPLRNDGGEADPLSLDGSSDSSETGLLLGPGGNGSSSSSNALPRPPHTAAAAGSASPAPAAPSSGEGGERSTSPASVAAAAGAGGGGRSAAAAVAGPAAEGEKGKERGEDVVTLRIKTLDQKEYAVELRPAASVGELKALIGRTVPGAEGRFLRLIMQGKLLSPDTALLTTFKVADRAVVHCVMSDRPPGARAAAGPHIGIDGLDDSGPPHYPEPDDDPATRRGFDRLRTHGFTVAEVAALRSYFTPQVQAYAARQPPREGEEADERRVRLEEEWMERQGEASEFALNTNRVMAQRALLGSRRQGEGTGEARVLEHGVGSGRDFTWGFIMGFTLGFISLFWLFNIPMSHQQKMGIIAGVSCNLVYSILRRQELEAAMGPPQDADDNVMPSEMPDGTPVVVTAPGGQSQGVGQ